MDMHLNQKFNKKPKIYFVAEGGIPLRFDTHAQDVYQVPYRLASKGLDVTLIIRHTELAPTDSERFGNLLVRWIPPAGLWKGKGWKAVGPMLLFLARVFYLLVKNARHYDIIVVCGSRILPYPVKLASTILGKKWILRFLSPTELTEEITPQSLDRMNQSRFSLIPKLLRSVRIPLIKRADQLIAITSEIREMLIDAGVDQRLIRYIPNGIDTAVICPVSCDEKLRIRKRLSLPRDKTIFTFTGRLCASKGVLHLIYVWNELVQKYRDVHLLLVGTGKGSFDNREKELRDYIRDHNLEYSVSLTGEVRNVYEYLQASDAFVFPSEYEGFGRSILEALACALPIVVTPVGVAKEHIQDRMNGILVKPEDRQDLQKGMEWLLDHRDLWATMGLNSREDVVETYSIETQLRQYLEMFDELVGS